MRSEKKWLRNLAIIATVAGFACGALADSIALNQVAYSFGGSLVAPYSATGEADVTYSPGSSLQYLNVVANGAWVVQNMPLLPLTVVGSVGTSQVYFNLGQLGAKDGTSFAGTPVSYFSQTTSKPLFAAPSSGASGSAVVGRANALTNSGVPSGVNDPPPPPPVNAIPWDAIAAYLGVETSFHKNMPNVVQEDMWCGPGAAANSLSWLGITGTTSLTDTMKDLAAKMHNRNDGNWDDEEASGKLQYMKENDLTVRVHYAGGEKLPKKGAYKDPVSGLTATNGGALTVKWLTDEMQKGQDIELMTATHWVVLESIISWDDFALIEYRDDPYQHGGATTDAEKAAIAARHVWTYFYKGKTDFGRGPQDLLAATAESVPEPPTWLLLLLPFALVFYRMWKTETASLPSTVSARRQVELSFSVTQRRSSAR